MPLRNALVGSVSNGNVIDWELTDATGQVAITVPTAPSASDYLEVVAAGWDGSNWAFMVADPNLGTGQSAVPSLGVSPAIWSWSVYTEPAFRR